MHGERFERLARAALSDLAGLLDRGFQLAAEICGKGAHRITGPSLSFSSTCLRAPASHWSSSAVLWMVAPGSTTRWALGSSRRLASSSARENRWGTASSRLRRSARVLARKAARISSSVPIGLFRRRLELIGSGERGALFVAQAAPHLRGGELVIAGLERGGEVALQLAERDAQGSGELFSQLRHRIGICQQSAAVGDGGDGFGAGLRFRQAGGKAVKIEQPLP